MEQQTLDLSYQYLANRLANVEILYAMLLDQKAAVERERDGLKAQVQALGPKAVAAD